MKTVCKLSEISRADSRTFGGKAAALRGLQESGFMVPATLCIATDAYKHFVSQNGLKEKIELELHRKKFSDMRWEEIWDAALRIRSIFL
ncbi:MAG: PEP/pyruvate-binding domain-containing protein, partial [Desulfobulbales bacterium]|nr:PEP/pyruvate-binding domain-containing protein [Desulfobulbales bacterium]